MSSPSPGLPATAHWLRRRALRVAAASVGLGLAVVALAFLQADVPDPVRLGLDQVQAIVRRFGVRSAVFLLYIEESGIPLPVPGDIWVMYVGAHVPRQWIYWAAAEFALVGAVVLGASNLYLVSRTLGPRITTGRFARVLHLTPERLEKAEGWFRRHGVAAIIFGRHIPGFRVPLTVAAGFLKVPFPKFAVSVAISTSVWAAVFLFVGISFGSRVTRYLELHRAGYWAFLLPAAMAVGVYAYAQLRRSRSKPPNS